MSIAKNIFNLRGKLPFGVELIAVSKTKPIEVLNEAYHAGQRHFGENKVQEMVQKHDAMPKDIHWHMIGHLQRNKVKYMASFVHLIHGVDNFSLLEEINKQGQKHNRVIDCLLQIKIAQEDTKFGLEPEEALAILQSDDYKEFENVKITGLMGMASFTTDNTQIQKEFELLKSTFDRFKILDPTIEILSMGMSGDFELAINCGSNMIRVGSLIFGERN
ncbi:MAG: YggS family pyridoxal phosphate-dependent enzyme [Bacteroidetes bacterium]|jgi:PLP dependent protein|nr:YggS family pyridoxal phosphate-dependent enzyme [Bacteroidota bacterium]MDA0880119.1 YggS family pyridoxal phosphate-dependent enzyme [Bacteroidota bacterium]MDA1116247.1 YggS family pyridoxal phosphate-dependent enzyme [Bacteroidota bacterium]